MDIVVNKKKDGSKRIILQAEEIFNKHSNRQTDR